MTNVIKFPEKEEIDYDDVCEQLDNFNSLLNQMINYGFKKD